MKNYLFILPFDHRDSFIKGLFGSRYQIEDVKELKWIIYSGFKSAVEKGLVSKSSAAILIDDQFGSEILEDASRLGYMTCLSVEKSGQKEFEFEHGKDYGEYIKRFNPTFAKALVRYNPRGDKDLNQRQLSRLKELSDFCKREDYRFLIEPLVVATDEQSKSYDKESYDKQLRPKLMIEMVSEMRDYGIEPDIWKIEGLEKREDYERFVEVIGPNSKAIILGRGADDSQVKKWLKAGRGVKGVIGFAIGRTIFWQALLNYRDNKIDKETAISEIAERYQEFYNYYLNK